MLIFRRYELVLGFLLGILLGAGIGDVASRLSVLQFSSDQEQHEAHNNPTAETNGQKIGWDNWTKDPISVFTFALTISTLFLWLATRKSAKISERALTELERPFADLVIVQTGLARKSFLYPLSERSFGVDNVNDLIFCFANYGRSPAVLTAREDRLRICDRGKLPQPIRAEDIREKFPYGVIIAPNDKSPMSTRVFPKDVFPDDRHFWLDVQRGTKDLFLMGVLQYENGFGTAYELKFCAVFVPETERFLMRGGQEYNSHKQV
jgi:hypothetical protein